MPLPIIHCFRCKQEIKQNEPMRVIDTRLSHGFGKKPMHDECALDYFQEQRRIRAEGGVKPRFWQQWR